MQLQVTQFSIKKHQHFYDSSPTDNITIADFQLVTATMCLEAINFDFSSYKAVSKWYDTYKKEYPDLWAIVEGGMKEIAEFEKNPPDLSHMDHPIHPVRKN
jgi:glutathione S-transferase